MSWEGHMQYLCPFGHYWKGPGESYNMSDIDRICPECGQRAAMENVVDDTNCDAIGHMEMVLVGYDEDMHALYLPPENHGLARPSFTIDKKDFILNVQLKIVFPVALRCTTKHIRTCLEKELELERKKAELDKKIEAYREYMHRVMQVKTLR